MSSPPLQNLARRHVVVVDDDPFMLKLLTRQLAQLGIRDVTATTEGAQALALVGDAARRVEVILLDINMPGMDGIEFLRQLATLEFAGEIVLVSGESTRMLESVQRLVRSHHLRVLGALQKPPTADALRDLLGAWHRGEQGASSGPRGSEAPTLTELSSAIDGGGIINHYQPQVALRSGEVVGVECLARWQQGNRMVAGPDLFIPMAEEFGLISRLTQCVLRNALRQCRIWGRLGIRLNVSVNVSMQDICSLDFPDVVAGLVDEAGIEPGQITLEVTESRVLRHLSTVLDVLGRLRLRRHHLAIDDFGTGHSSLAQLRDLPFDELKIDRGFVDGASGNATQRAICEATLRMAAQLGMRVVAEGIEQEADRRMLQDLGCEIGQGYLIARPMAPDKLTAWLQARAPRP